MYAIVETGGKQYRVKPGDTIAVERLTGEPGDVLDLDRVLLVAGNGDASTRIGTPGVENAVVRAEVVEHGRGEKIIVFRYKSKVRYRRKTGHRQSLTRLRITDILLDGASTVASAERAPAAEASPAAVAEPAEAPTPTDAEEAVAPTRRRRATRSSEEPTPAEPSAETEMPTSAGESGPPPEEQSAAEPPTEQEA
jgi:large subunit ribosomal protein L21